MLLMVSPLDEPVIFFGERCWFERSDGNDIIGTQTPLKLFKPGRCASSLPVITATAAEKPQAHANSQADGSNSVALIDDEMQVDNEQQFEIDLDSLGQELEKSH